MSPARRVFLESTPSGDIRVELKEKQLTIQNTANFFWTNTRPVAGRRKIRRHVDFAFYKGRDVSGEWVVGQEMVTGLQQWKVQEERDAPQRVHEKAVKT